LDQLPDSTHFASEQERTTPILDTEILPSHTHIPRTQHEQVRIDLPHPP
jgi:hypothetical protein